MVAAAVMQSHTCVIAGEMQQGGRKAPGEWGPGQGKGLGKGLGQMGRRQEQGEGPHL